MFKSLLDYNSPQNVWLRENPFKMGLIGSFVAALFIVPTVYKIIKERRND